MSIELKIIWYLMAVTGLLFLLADLPRIVLWLLLALAVGAVVYVYAILIRNGDEIKQENRERRRKSLQTNDIWARFSRARHAYNRDIEQWMSPDELRQRRGF